jgi:SAM-dependent methyltransferase
MTGRTPAALPRSTPMGAFSFTCNICGAWNHREAPLPMKRAAASCDECGSNPRWRAVVHALSLALFGKSLTIPDFPSRELAGIGMTDHPSYATRLAAKLAYRNTFMDRDPKLDITDPPPELFETLDFVISSDVLEHVAPPVQRAFANSYRLLKPGGVLVVTVPSMPSTVPDTDEHFPNLHEWEILDFKGDRILVNRTAAGDWEVFHDLRFHGCDSLEMRVFSHSSLLRALREAGFAEITEWTTGCPEFGLPWPKKPKESPGAPVVARR